MIQLKENGMTWYSGLEHIVRERESLSSLTQLRIGGPAEFFAEPTSLEELAELINRCTAQQIPMRILGGGSRVLVSDDGIKGLVVQLSTPAFCEINVDGDVVTSGGGAKLGHLVSTAVREGMGGLESLVGIPGTVAGALKGNSDSNGTSIGQWVESVTVMNRQGQVEEIEKDQLLFSYRRSNLNAPVILASKFRLERQNVDELTRRLQKIWIIKRSQQPSNEFGHGRIFADAQGMGAGELVDQSGMRHHRVGNAEVWEGNPNYIIANPGATASDVKSLIDSIQAQVEKELGVKLERELQLW